MEIKVPAVGESIYEAVIDRWLKENGDQVSKDETLCEIETDKVTLEVTAEADGILSISAQQGETVKIGAVIGTIDEKGAKSPTPARAAAAEKQPQPERREQPAEPAQPAPPAQAADRAADKTGQAPKPARSPQPAQPEQAAPPISPSGRKLAREMG